MPGEKTREQLNADLNARLGAAIAGYAEEHGLTEEDVMRSVRELLLEKQPPEAEA